MEVRVIKNFYSKDLIHLLQYQCQILKNSSSAELDEKIFFRKQVHNHPLFKVLHNQIDAEKVFEKEVKPSYVYTSMYIPGKGIVPLHTDRDQCKYTIDLCINQKYPWGIFVNDKEYFLEPGDALIYSGTDHPHYRNKIQDDNFCDLAFFHFVDKNFTGGLN